MKKIIIHKHKNVSFLFTVIYRVYFCLQRQDELYIFFRPQIHIFYLFMYNVQQLQCSSIRRNEQKVHVPFKCYAQWNESERNGALLELDCWTISFEYPQINDSL